MEAAAAFGVAAGVVQFITFSLTTLKLCREIRDDTKAATKHNRELEDATKLAEKARKDLVDIHSTAGRRFKSIVQSCSQDATELLSLLAQVRGAQDKVRSKRLNDGLSLLRSLKEKRTIEKLENALRDKERQLNELLVQDMHKTVQDVRTSISELDPKVEDGIAAFTTAIAKLGTELPRTISQAKEEIKTVIETIDANLNSFTDREQQSSRRKQIIDSICFPEIRARLDNIKPPHSGTAEWVFTMRPQHSARHWDDFDKWLRESDSIYWISGKAASGKSTLMAHIMQDHRTSEGLRQWAKGTEPRILSFYFWRLGPPVLTTTLGLLRSLLYQMLVSSPDLVDRISFEERAALHPSYWSEKKVMETLKTVLRSDDSKHTCVFIDGLDEYEGFSDDLVDYIFELQAIHKVKFCVSSRPEVNLTSRLSSCQKLRVEDYNRADIMALASAKLAKEALPLGSREYERSLLVRLIADRASGIFLWAILATQSLITGLRSHDDMATIYQRLNVLPKELERLFTDLFDSIQEFHKKSLAEYFQILKLGRTVNLCELAIGSLNGNLDGIESYGQFFDVCQQVRARIIAQSAGMLELTPKPYYDHDCDTVRECYIVKSLVPELRGPNKSMSRSLVSGSCYCAGVLNAESQRLAWVHVSAADYIFPNDGRLSPIAAYLDNDLDIRQRLFYNSLQFLKIGPSPNIFVETFFDAAIPAEYKFGEVLLSNMRMRRVVAEFWSGELNDPFYGSIENWEAMEACANQMPSKEWQMKLSGHGIRPDFNTANFARPFSLIMLLQWLTGAPEFVTYQAATMRRLLRDALSSLHDIVDMISTLPFFKYLFWRPDQHSALTEAMRDGAIELVNITLNTWKEQIKSGCKSITSHDYDFVSTKKGEWHLFQIELPATYTRWPSKEYIVGCCRARDMNLVSKRDEKLLSLALQLTNGFSGLLRGMCVRSAFRTEGERIAHALIDGMKTVSSDIASGKLGFAWEWPEVETCRLSLHQSPSFSSVLCDRFDTIFDHLVLPQTRIDLDSCDYVYLRCRKDDALRRCCIVELRQATVRLLEDIQCPGYSILDMSAVVYKNRQPTKSQLHTLYDMILADIEAARLSTADYSLTCACVRRLFSYKLAQAC